MNIRGERILILGDSLSSISPFSASHASIIDLEPATPGTTSPGAALGKKLLAAGAQAVRVNARVGRSALSYMGLEQGAGLIAADVADFKPTKVIVFLGTNDINRGTTPDALMRTTAAFAQIRDGYKRNGAEVFAFGPPIYLNANYAFEAPTMFETIRKVFGTDKTLDIRQLTIGAARSQDGVHFKGDGPDVVAQRIMTKLPLLGRPATITAATGGKVALAVVGFGGIVGLAWLTTHVARKADHRKMLAVALKAGRTAGRWFARRY